MNVFFYNNLTNTNFINKITFDYECFNGYVLVHSFDKNKNVLIINEERAYMLEGKLVRMNIPFEVLLLKLSYLDEVKYKNRLKYNVELIDVHLENNKIEKAWIIY